MIVKYSVLGYLIGEGFRNVLKNKKSTAASLMIMCATMFVFGIFFLIGQNVQNVIKQVEEQQAMQVFIKPDATEQEITDLGTKIREIEYVNKAEYVTKEDALNTVKTWLKDSQGLLEPYAKNNPFNKFIFWFKEGPISFPIPGAVNLSAHNSTKSFLPTIYAPLVAIPAPKFFIKEPTAISAPASIGSFSSTNSP